MFTVNKSRVDLIDGKLVGEASTMELPPGEWPDFIAVLDDNNEGFLFHRGKPDVSGDDIVGFTYTSNSGLQLFVLND